MSDEQTPLTNEPRPRSLKRVVAASVAVALALGVCAVKAADHGPLALIEIPNPFYQYCDICLFSVSCHDVPKCCHCNKQENDACTPGTYDCAPGLVCVGASATSHECRGHMQPTPR